MPRKSKAVEIPDSKIRIVIWKLKIGKTKKECCEFLGIAYNTTRLNKIVEDFKKKEETEKRLKTKNKSKEFSATEIKAVISDYVNGESISKIAERYYVSFPRVKKLLIDNNVPIRARGNKKSADVSHITQDLDIKFSIGDKVFIPGPNADEYIDKNKALIKLKNIYGKVIEVFDEDYIDNLSNGYIKETQLFAWRNLKPDQIPVEGIHFERYWYLDNGNCWGKLLPFQQHIKNIGDHLITYGREFYRIKIDNKDKRDGLYTLRRDELYPINIEGENIEIQS